MNRKQTEAEIDLLQLAKVLWRRAWIIILAMLFCGALGFSYARYCITPLYQAKAMMYVNNSSISVGSTTVNLSDLSAAQKLVNTYIVILKTRATLNDVIEQADLDYSYQELADMISASPVNSTEIFEIVVTGPNPREAEKIANTIAEILPEKISDIVEGSSVRIVDYAVVPSQKSSPSITRYAGIGLLLGALLSCGILILRELLDEQIRGEDYLRQNYDLPVLAAIPDLRSAASSGAAYYGSYASRTKEVSE